jgi:hypothetical protein
MEVTNGGTEAQWRAKTRRQTRPKRGGPIISHLLPRDLPLNFHYSLTRVGTIASPTVGGAGASQPRLEEAPRESQV